MSEPESQFELVEFEQVEAAPGTALLRVAGRPAADLPTGHLTLVVSNGATEHRHEQLPALPGPPGLIRAAFSAPLEHLGHGATYSLALPGGGSVRLPAPMRRRAFGGPPTPPAGAGADAGSSESGTDASAGSEAAEHEGTGSPSRLVEAERRAESRRLAIAELERRLQSERERRAAAESDLAHLRTERDEARSERDAAVAERDEAVADRDQAEARARAAAASAGALEAQVRAASDGAVRAQASLESQLADRTAELERIRSAAEVAQARAHASRLEATSLDEQLAHAQAQLAVLEQALAQAEAELSTLTATRDDAVAAARAEAAQAYEQVSVQEERIEAERHRNTELESRIVDLEDALSDRDAEVDVLRQGTSSANQAELEQFRERVRDQVRELQNSREELVAAAQATQQALDLERARADAAEQKLTRAQEELVVATAEQALRSEALAFEASRHS